MHATLFYRDRTIDRFRGFAVLIMIVVQIWRDFTNLEFLSRLGNHRVSSGLTIIDGMQFADMFAPMFLFAVALTYKSSFDNRCIKEGSQNATKHFLKRYILLIGIGGILRAIESLIFFISHGFVEKNVDYVFFAGLFLLLIFLVGKVFSCFIKNSTIDSFFSNAISLATGAIACLCLLSTARDFFVQFLNIATDNFNVWGYWEALQAIGGAGLITLIFVKRKTMTRFAFATIIFITYTVFHETGNHSEMISVYAQQGGFIGILGQSCIVLYGTVFADLYQKDKEKLTRYLSLLPVFGISAIIFIKFIAPTMRSVSPSYILINLFISGTVFLIFKLYEFINIKFDVLSLLGQNALIIYLLQYVLIYGAKEIIGYDYIRNATDLYAMSFTIIMVSLLLIIAYWMNKRKIIIKL